MSMSTPAQSSPLSGERLIATVRRLTNREVVSRVTRLARDERHTTASLIAHLAIVDERQLYLTEGCASLFTYLTERLGFSEYAAYGRIQAARAGRRFPIILELLAEGSINLTAVALLGPELTDHNHQALLAAARHKSRREVEALVAQLRPRAPLRWSIRRLPPARTAPAASDAASAAPSSVPANPSTASAAPAAPSPTGKVATAPGDPRLAPGGADPGAADEGAGPPGGTGIIGVVPPQPPGRPLPVPTSGSGGRLDLFPAESPDAPGGMLPSTEEAARILSPDAYVTTIHGFDRCLAYRILFSATPETYRKLRAAQDLLRHQIPDGDVGQILDRALSLLLNDLVRRKVGASPRAASPVRREPPAGNRSRVSGSRYIPGEVRRAVWIRDRGRCAYVSPDGTRCSERAFLEFHHVVPFSAGGEATVENIQLRCSAHNRYEARLASPSSQAGITPAPPERPAAPGTAAPASTAVTDASQGPVEIHTAAPSPQRQASATEVASRSASTDPPEGATGVDPHPRERAVGVDPDPPT